MRKNFLTFGSPNIGEEEIAEVVDTLRSGWIGTGPKVGAFEKAFAAYVGADYAVAVSSCTAALHLSMMVSGVGPGDEVITTPMTFCATANAIVHTGASPVFVDVDPKTMNIDPGKIEAAITPKTKAIVPVHFAGRACDMQAICKIARQYDLMVIEDAAHAIETTSELGKVGNIGDLTCFSFYVTKNVVTAEGGMITTNRSEWIDKLKTNALHGMNRDAWKRYSDDGFKHYEVEFPGYKYNMTDIQASLGIHQLSKVDSNLVFRKDLWSYYNRLLEDMPLIIPSDPEHGEVHGLHLYTILVDKENFGCSRDERQKELHERKIGTGIHYVAAHLHPYYQTRWGYKRGDFPCAEYISDRTLSLPLGVNMNYEDVDDVFEAIRSVQNA